MTQVPTVSRSITWIMRQRTFALGVSDARAGRPFRLDYDRWPPSSQEGYERGRQWAVLAPPGLALKSGGLTAEAIFTTRTRAPTIFSGDPVPLRSPPGHTRATARAEPL
jgi:hypothetical protein